MESKHIIYLDTSGLNYLADKVKSFDDFSKIKNHLNFEFYLSPITLWEILLNGNDERKDYLIYWSQFNCANNLIKSPTELILDFIKLDCPLKDRKEFYTDPYTKMDLGITWQNIHRKIDKTIPIDLNELKEKTKPIRDFSKKLKKIITDMCNEEYSNYNNDPFHKAMLKVCNNLDYSDSQISKYEKLIKIALVFLFFIICIGVELQNNLLRAYWKELKIEEPFDKLDYLIDNYPMLLNRGPLVEMAKMADEQLKMSNSKSRGLLHDCFHAIYCYYTDNVITGDEHFKSLRKNEKDTIFSRILMTEEIELIWEETLNKLTNQRSQ
jgi:hypothetical protein